METSKKLGICMDHSTANIMEYKTGVVKTNMVALKCADGDIIGGVVHNDNGHELEDYYKELTETIKKYNEVVLFGATNAKLELYSLLIQDHWAETIKIEIKQTGKMSQHQQHAFVMEHFSLL